MFDEFASEEPIEIVENVDDFIDGSPMRPSGPIIRKGRLPPKRHFTVKQDLTKYRSISPQSVVCSPYSNLCAQCIVDEFAQQTLKGSKLIRRRVSRSVIKRVVVDKINTSEVHSNSTRSSIFSSSQRQRLSTSKRLSCSQLKKSANNTLHSCQKLPVHSNIQDCLNQSAMNKSQKGHTVLTPEMGEKTNHSSLNLLYTPYNNSVRKESIRQKSKHSLCASNLTKRKSVNHRTMSELELTDTSTIPACKLNTCKTLNAKPQTFTKNSIPETYEQVIVDATFEESGESADTNHHVLCSVCNRHSSPRVLNKNEIDKISKSIFRKGKEKMITTENKMHKMFDCNIENSNSENIKVHEESQNVLENSEVYVCEVNKVEEHAIERVALGKECNKESPSTFHQDKSEGKVKSEPPSFLFTDNNAVTYKAFSAPNNSLLYSAELQHIVCRSNNNNNNNDLKLMHITESNSVGNECETYANNKKLENSSIPVQHNNLITEHIALDQRQEQHENLQEMYAVKSNEKPHAYQLTQNITRLSDMITSVSNNSIFDFATDEYLLADDDDKDHNCIRKSKKNCYTSQSSCNHCNDVNEVDSTQLIEKDKNKVKKCEEHHNTTTWKVNVIEKSPIKTTPPSSSLPRWQDAFSSLSSPLADCLTTIVADSSLTQETDNISTVLKQPYREKKSLHKEYELPANNILLPTPESIDSREINLMIINNKTVKRDQSRRTTKLIEDVLEQQELQESKIRNVTKKPMKHNNINNNDNEISTRVECQVSSLITHNKVRNTSLAQSIRCRNSRAPSTLHITSDLHKSTCIDTGIGNSKNINRINLITAQKNDCNRHEILVSKIEIDSQKNKDEKLNKTITNRDKEMHNKASKAHTCFSNIDRTSLLQEMKVETPEEQEEQEQHVEHEEDRELPRQRIHSNTHTAHTPSLTKSSITQNSQEQPITRYSRLVAQTQSTVGSRCMQTCNVKSGTKCEKLPEIVPAGRRKSNHKVTRTPSFV